jgi:hypothetical protein
MARTKDMLAELNQMLDDRAAGREPDFDGFMERYGDFFPENPRNLDELLETMARRMAAMQAMLNSMTPEQRAQLQGLSEQLLEDLDLRWQMDQLSANLQQAFPDAGWNRRYDFSGQDPLGFADAAQIMNELGDLDQLEQLLRGAANPGALAEVDLDRARQLLGPEAADSLERMAELAKLLEEAGLIENREGRYELTPEGLRRVGKHALRDLFSKLARDKFGQHELIRTGPPRAHARHQALRVRRPVQPPHRAHHPQRGGPQRWGHAGALVARGLRDRADRADHPLGHRAHGRPLAVHAHARQLPGRQEGGHGTALAHQQPLPPRLPGPGGLQ